MKNYKKKPIVVSAEQWWPGKTVDGVDYPGVDNSLTLLGEYGEIKTLEGTLIVTPGDFIITGVKGEKYACKPDVFEATYDLV